ncbi:metal-sensitive transcriptional regulator [Streptomyces sp. NPDC088923]|uniref:metal-sensitive transcriptional regulator n=1 Tax=Streptomyces sp. NPDC088923 TaxID=3365913 RepID=UPI00382FE177
MTTTEAEGTGAATPTGAPHPTGPDTAGAEAQAAGHAVHGYHDHKQEHLKRLRRIEGQIRGLQRMVEEDQYCIDILTQVSASTKALQSFALQLLEEHLRHCVADAAVRGGDEVEEKVAEATRAIARMLRT